MNDTPTGKDSDNHSPTPKITNHVACVAPRKTMRSNSERCSSMSMSSSNKKWAAFLD
jgi:hypothetical protein